MKRIKTFFALILIGILPFLFTCGGGGGGNGGGGGDTTAPSTPTNLTATAASSSQINLSWTASTDNVGVAGYNIYRYGTYLKSVTATSTSDTGLSANTQYCYTVSAYDAAGNESAQSNQACAITYTPEVSATIGPSGGIVEVTNPSSPLYGVKIEIPSNALSQETTITISKVEDGDQGIVVNIGPSGTTFNIPATVSLPYKDETNEEFLAVFSAEEGQTNWTHHPNYVFDTNSNSASFNVSHLSKNQVALIMVPSEIKIFFKGGSTHLDAVQNETAKTTIREVIMNGPWKEFYDCAGVTLSEVANEDQANISIRWEDIPDDYTMEWNSATQKFEVKTNFISGQATTYCGEINGNQVCWPKAIVLNERMFQYNKPGVHITLDQNVGSSLDLYSIIAHELGHILGLPDYKVSDPTNAITDKSLTSGEMQRFLTEIDKDRITRRHSECKEEEIEVEVQTYCGKAEREWDQDNPPDWPSFWQSLYTEALASRSWKHLLQCFTDYPLPSPLYGGLIGYMASPGLGLANIVVATEVRSIWDFSSLKEKGPKVTIGANGMGNASYELQKNKYELEFESNMKIESIELIPFSGPPSPSTYTDIYLITVDISNLTGNGILDVRVTGGIEFVPPARDDDATNLLFTVTSFQGVR